ncbi:MAG: sirohydrochlorin chelatase [Planctomycetota bacterium]|jgi:sirohydrochlorin cobaltochelatase
MVIFIAHGSRDPHWRASVESLIGSLATDLGPDRVRLAYMDCTPPTLMDVASEAVRGGATSIRVVPLFLTEQGHVDRDVRPMVEQVRDAFAGVDVDLLPPVGRHPLFREMLHEIAGQASE